jgi:hypothetical protein
MANRLRESAYVELKNASAIINADANGWKAIHLALTTAAQSLGGGEHDLLEVALKSVKRATDAGYPSSADASTTRFTGKGVMEWQDALYVVNELPEWQFADDVLLVGWMVECGGPEMGRGPARASFHSKSAEHYVGRTRRLFNAGKHGNGPGWPLSTRWTAEGSRYMNLSRV